MSQEHITSRANPYIKELALLSDRKHRHMSSKFFFEGRKLFIEALENKVELESVIMTEKFFNKYKEKSVLELLSIFNDCLPQVKTNISKDDMEELMLTVLDNRITKLEEFRIPVSGTFSSVKIGGADVISVKWDKNIQELHKRIFGDAN